MRLLRPILAAVCFLWAHEAFAVDCQYRATSPTLSNQDLIILQCDQNGRLLQGAQIPTGVTSTNVSGTIAATGVFQSIAVANTARRGCSIQNIGANAMWLYFGAIAGATTAKSFLLMPGNTANCAAGTTVVTDQISITGTATDTFSGAVQ